MAQVSNIFGTNDDQEILTSLYIIVNVSSPSPLSGLCSPRGQNTGGLGLIHESINIYNDSDYTRPWFAWANSYFAEMLLDLAQRKPHLIFKDSRPYTPFL